MMETIGENVLDSQKKRFFKGTDEIKERLQKRGITEKEIIKDLERRREQLWKQIQSIPKRNVSQKQLVKELEELERLT